MKITTELKKARKELLDNLDKKESHRVDRFESHLLYLANHKKISERTKEDIFDDFKAALNYIKIEAFEAGSGFDNPLSYLPLVNDFE